MPGNLNPIELLCLCDVATCIPSFQWERRTIVLTPFSHARQQEEDSKTIVPLEILVAVVWKMTMNLLWALVPCLVIRVRWAYWKSMKAANYVKSGVLKSLLHCVWLVWHDFSFLLSRQWHVGGRLETWHVTLFFLFGGGGEPVSVAKLFLGWEAWWYERGSGIVCGIVFCAVAVLMTTTANP